MKLKCMAGILLLLVAAPLAALAAGGNTIYRHIESIGEPIPFAIHLPPDFDAESSYPVLIGPGDAEEGSDPGFYWQTDPHIKAWVIVDAQIWDIAGSGSFAALLDAVAMEINVEGGKFHAVCWSANSAAIFQLITDHAERFHSITGMAGYPRVVSAADIEALQTVKVQFVVGENDPYWQRSARDAYEKLLAGGVDTTFEVVPNGEHVMTNLIGEPFIQKLEKLR
jgi:hypothetical protein